MSFVSYDIIPYDSEEFHKNFHLEKNNALFTISEKDHITYFKDYFSPSNGLNAKFIVKEKDYISRDYLSDFSSYYSTCFEKYEKLCTRLHFFTFHSDDLNEFKKTFTEKITCGPEENKEFWSESYLGFIVSKPIPNSVIGYTVLRHYNFNENNQRYDTHRKLWGTKNYKIHIFGNEVVIDSLAFQEQDRALAACATIAIWCMLQKAAEDYYVILKSPGEITNDTSSIDHNGNRLFPNKGLIVPDMCRAITKNGLVTEVRHKSDEKNQDFNLYIKKIVNAYSPIGIPILLGLDVPVKGKYFGHAVAICGHKETNEIFDEKNNSKHPLKNLFPSKRNTKWYAECITQLYVHDDQWGPFSRMEFEGENELKTAWSYIKKESMLCQPVVVISSVFPKIRISYDDIELVVNGLDKLIFKILKNELNGNIVWDIKLHLSEKYKEKFNNNDIFDNANENDFNLKLKILTKNFPKYIWIATCKINNYNVFDFIFDATGLVKSMLGLAILCYYSKLPTKIHEYLTDKIGSRETLMSDTDNLLTEEYFLFIRNKIMEFSTD